MPLLENPVDTIASIGNEIKTELINLKTSIDNQLNYLAVSVPGRNKGPAMKAHNELMIMNSRMNGVLFNIIHSFPKPPKV